MSNSLLAHHSSPNLPQAACRELDIRPVSRTTTALRILAALVKLNQRPRSENTRSVILAALGAMNIAAAYGVPGGREAIVADLLVEMVSDIGAIA